MVEILKVLNILLLMASLSVNAWALIDLIQAIRSVDNELKRNTGLVMGFGFLSMSVVSALSIVIYTTNLDHSITFIRTMAAAVANICFGLAYYLLRKGII